MGKPWKELEKTAAEELGGVRINRANDYGISDVDVVVPALPFLRIDCKYRAAHAHHSLVEEIREKYCSDNQYPVLVTKHRNGRREYVTVDLSLFAALIKEVINKGEENENVESASEGAAQVEERQELD